MKQFAHFLFSISLFAILFSAVAQESQPPKEGIVSTAKLVIRAKPGKHFEGLGTLFQDEKVTIVSETEEWYEIRLPDRIQGWVTAESVDANGVVLQNNCPIYSGPAVVFTVFSKIPRGTKLELIENAAQNWRLAKVPPMATAWVNKAYVTLPAAKEPNPQETASAPHPESPIAPSTTQTEAAKLQTAQQAAQDAEQLRLANEAKAKEAESLRLANEAKANEAESLRLAAQQAALQSEAKRTEAELKEKVDAPKSADAEKAARLAEEKRLKAENDAKLAQENAEKQKAEQEKQRALQEAAKQQEQQKQEEERKQKEFAKAPTYTGYIVSLGSNATVRATHILYPADTSSRKAICFLASQRIPLNDWNQKRVEVSGQLILYDGWTVPVLNVVKIITK